MSMTLVAAAVCVYAGCGNNASDLESLNVLECDLKSGAVKVLQTMRGFKGTTYFQLSADGKYVTVTNAKNIRDGYFSIFVGDGSVTGQYLLVKYRTTSADQFEWYVKSKGKGWGNFYMNPNLTGEWQTIIIDLSI